MTAFTDDIAQDWEDDVLEDWGETGSFSPAQRLGAAVTALDFVFVDEAGRFEDGRLSRHEAAETGKISWLATALSPDLVDPEGFFTRADDTRWHPVSEAINHYGVCSVQVRRMSRRTVGRL